MGWLARFGISVFLMTSLVSVAVAQSEADMEEDAEKIEELYNMLMKIGDFRINANISGAYGTNYPKFQKKLKQTDLVKSIRATNKPWVDAFAKKYAPNETQDFKVPGALNRKFLSIQIENIGSYYQTVQERFEWAQTAPDGNAMAALKWINDGLKLVDYAGDIYKVRSVEELRKVALLVPKFSPGNERAARRAQRILPKIDAKIEAVKAAHAAALAKRMWPKGVSSTSVGSPASLSAAGMRFLNGQSDWGGNTKRGTKILKVTIKGDWYVAERTLIGTPLRYGLPAYIAVSDNTIKPEEAIVYEVTFVTKNPRKETNFLGVWVGDVYMMYKKNVK